MDQSLWTLARAAAALLLLGNLIIFPGLMMFWIRGGWRAGARPPSPAAFAWERGFIFAGIIVTVIGFMLLEGQLENTAGGILARIGAIAYLMAGIFGVAGEALGLAIKDQNLYPLIVVYVVVAFLAQAMIGGALLQAGLVAGWIGVATVVWNLAWLVVLPLLTPRDIYFPVLHHVMPLVIGIALLLQVPSA
jgi:hypothetical protein